MSNLRQIKATMCCGQETPPEEIIENIEALLGRDVYHLRSRFRGNLVDYKILDSFLALIVEPLVQKTYKSDMWWRRPEEAYEFEFFKNFKAVEMDDETFILSLTLDNYILLLPESETLDYQGIKISKLPYFDPRA